MSAGQSPPGSRQPDTRDDPYVFTADSLPSDPRFLATVANGYLGTRAFGSVLHVGGIYNGLAGACHRADVPSPLAVQLELPQAGTGPPRHSYTLDTRRGVFSHCLSSGAVSVSQELFAHRAYPNLLAMELRVERRATPGEPVTVQLRSAFAPQSEDISLQAGPDFRGGRHVFGQTLTPEEAGGPQPHVHLIWTPVPSSLTLPSARSEECWVFLTAVADSAERAQSAYALGLSLIGSGDLSPSHCRAWAELWQGCGVELVGPSPVRRAVIGCLYYLLSAFPPLHDSSFLFGGVSPGGLSNGRRGQDYWGHVFWDQDTWVYPGIALFYPELARHVLGYRLRTLPGAAENARAQGCQGVKFPWESALSGKEVCEEKLYGQQEIHINGDVSLAFRQYLYLTQDLALFSDGGGWELVKAVAEYWASRVAWSSEERSYHIRGVMPPDEFHSSVDNSVYTNAVAKQSLQFAVELASLLHIPPPPQWQDIADQIKIPFDLEQNYHPEFDGYKTGEKVKQADVVLLGYPLGYPMSPEVRRNDLEVYEPVTDPQGPAMTWGMFAVGWLELREASRAQELLMRNFNNIQEPFQVWSEGSDGSGTVNFLTGMGGFLQAVLFGYTGFREAGLHSARSRGAPQAGQLLASVAHGVPVSVSRATPLRSRCPSSPQSRADLNKTP
ncbi:protein-glucosylgalactosylhydroxylysine glucosidase isoform X2 [Lepisosteus oculatus]|uniref:protein-glucosylgalactosylhydroxylysine glucosidase isoform X2 n=1 Tax=Lepisosteus oculatus TaxID=7918 RepID=UPI0035F527A2